MTVRLLLLLALAITASAQVRFRNVAKQAGLDFVLEHHPTAKKHLPETMAGGVAAFDYDGDGLTDIFFTNGAAIPSLEKEAPRYRNRLYRNEGGMKFRDATADAGLEGEGYSTAAAAADFDNDGDVDLFVGGVRKNHLYRNEGNGKFKDVAAAAGIAGGRWNEGAAWLDFDRDGHLDLFVVNYLDWSPEMDVYCGDKAINVRAYCHPKLFKGLPNALYRNRGDGTFEDVSAKSGIAAHRGKGMSAAIADLDRDGHIDIFVTNDKIPNFLFRNKGNGTFEEIALLAGGALQDSGMAVSAMGTDFRDVNNDGFPDIAFAALAGETFPLFLNDGKGGFNDAGHTSKMAPLSYNRSGWSIGLFDFDNDGWKDIFTSNAHVNDTVESFEAAKYKLTNSIFLNKADGTFRDATAGSGLEAEVPRAHRGAAFADFNRDGKVDVVITSLGAAAELWENVTESKNNWLILKLRGSKSNRDGIGAQVLLARQHNHVTTATGYISSSHSGVHFGLGAISKVDRIEIRWPSGAVQTLENVPANQILEVREP